MKCPKCNGTSYTVTTHATDQETYRQYRCKVCGNVFYTREVINRSIYGGRPYFKKGEKKLMSRKGRRITMAQIIITLNKNDIGDLLLGGEVNIKPSVQRFDNLTNVIIKMDEHSYGKAEEVSEDD